MIPLSVNKKQKLLLFESNHFSFFFFFLSVLYHTNLRDLLEVFRYYHLLSKRLAKQEA